MNETEYRLSALERARMKIMWGIILICLVVIGVLVMSARANAQYYLNSEFNSPLEVIILKGGYSVSDYNADLIAHLSSQILSEAKVGDLGAYYTLKDRYRGLYSIENSLEKYLKYSDYFAKKKPYNRKTRHYIMSPPMFSDGKWGWLGGWSKVCQNRKRPRYSYGNAIRRQLYTGAPRLTQSAIAMAHETLHMMGARHDGSDCNVMHPGAMGCAGDGNLLHIKPKAIQQIKNCYARSRF